VDFVSSAKGGTYFLRKKKYNRAVPCSQNAPIAGSIQKSVIPGEAKVLETFIYYNLLFNVIKRG
jgi:hypothetical protein